MGSPGGSHYRRILEPGTFAMTLRRVSIARALSLFWSAFWTIFFVAESWAWDTPLPLALPWVGAGLLFILLALLPWRWQTTGGILLIIAGFLIGAGYVVWGPPSLPLAGRVISTVTLSLPPLIAGILFLAGRIDS
jgi:hypothetical protein